MKIAIVHYHAGPGGVMEVIRATSHGLTQAEVPHVILVGASPAPEAHDLPIVIVDGLEYGGGDVTAASLLGKLCSAASAALGAQPDIWHFHNHSLGKNTTMHELVALLAARHERLFLHIHDLAEDGRPENAARLGDRRHLYPSEPRVHYAFLNSRDRECFLHAGLHPARAHLLPNPISRRSPEFSGPSAPLWLYPVRGIRRKNLGEFILLVALAAEGTRGAVTRAPLNPLAKPIHDGWARFARENRIAVEFNVEDRLEPVSHAGSSFESWRQHATHFVTTSVSEGFGMAFLGSIACGKPLLGRNLPHLAADHASCGLGFPGLYDRLLIPAGWVDLAILESALRETTTGLWSAWRGEPPAIANIHVPLERDGFYDFGNLPEVLQQRVIAKLMEPGMKSLPMVECGGVPRPAAAWLAEVAALPAPSAGLPDLCDPKIYRQELIRVYQKMTDDSDANAAGKIDPEIILDSCLAPARFHFLTSPVPVRRPPPDFHTFRAIVFDIYGTLLIAPAGGVRPDVAVDPALREIIARLGYQPLVSPSSALHASVLRHHAASRMPHPEIDLRVLWREVLALQPDADTTTLVIETEAVWHPARIMPGAEKLLGILAAAGKPLGLLSNAQCNTLPSLGDLKNVFADDLVILSFRHGAAKPSPILFDLLATRLSNRGITPGETLYIGNDPLHDMEPAAAHGFITALFTGHPDSSRAGACLPDYEIRSWSG